MKYVVKFDGGYIAHGEGWDVDPSVEQARKFASYADAAHALLNVLSGWQPKPLLKISIVETNE